MVSQGTDPFANGLRSSSLAALVSELIYLQRINCQQQHNNNNTHLAYALSPCSIEGTVSQFPSEELLELSDASDSSALSLSGLEPGGESDSPGTADLEPVDNMELSHSYVEVSVS